ncbi:MAG: NAD(P)H-dependent oxidoreductase subunit E [Firmicutes bacterium]|nr:NAD(P)H-dependent oxidoreductase subunit E [Bacillota bacterium]
MERPPSGGEADAAERAAVDAVLGPPESAWTGGARAGPDLHVARRPPDRRHLLLPALRAVAARRGFISPGAVAYLAGRLGLPAAEVYGVASFYALLPLEPRPPVTVHVCDDVVCAQAGAEAVARALAAAWGPAGQPRPGAPAIWQRTGCLGQCAAAPAVLVTRSGEAAGEAVLAPADPATAAARAVDPGDGGDRPPLAADPAPAGGILLGGGRGGDPLDLDAYRARGGYQALRRALELGPEGVVREIREAGLTGRGGAGFPTAVKWAAVAQQTLTPHYVVCNADESEPGTFKDRLLLETDPYAVLEGLTIAAWATGARQGYVFLRAEYPLARERLEAALAEARARGFLGEEILGRAFRFEVEVRVGAGAYVCGEETALFNAIEGRRGEPRNKPPFPAVHGLFGRPTAVNNVETLATVPAILRLGAAAYAARGTAGAPGTRLFPVSGTVRRPGVYEADLGTRLGDLLERAGGLTPGRRLQAILLGGAAGSFVGPEALDMTLTPAGAAAFGATLGSGAVMVFDQQADLRGMVRRIARFFREESCGQCVPCRIGTQRQLELVERLAAGRPLGSLAAEQALHRDLAAVMRDASICGLGQTAANAVESALRLGVFGEGGQ